MASSEATAASATSAASSTTSADDVRVSVLETVLWKRLAEAKDLRELAAPWIELQCGLISAECGTVALIKDGGNPQVLASWPVGTKQAALVAAALAAVEERRGIVQQAPASGAADTPGVLLSYPILQGERAIGAAAVALDGRVSSDLRRITRQLQWGVAWLRERVLADVVAQSERRRRTSVVVLELLAGVFNTEGFAAACRAAATALAHEFACERVGIGFSRYGSIRVAEISHTAQFGQNMNTVRLIRDAMEEAMDQRAALLYPGSPDEPHVMRAHAALAAAHNSGSILTVPMFAHDRFIGAITFEHSGEQPFDTETMAVLDGAVCALAPILETMRRDDRWLIARLVDAIERQGSLLFGPDQWGRKLALAGAIAAAGFAYFATGMYRVTGDAEIEGRIQRSVVATFNGFIKDAPARPGDSVTEGQTLAVLDDSDLVLERLRWVTERQQKVFERERAIGERDRAKVNITSAEIEKAEAQIKLVDEELSRTRITAPFNGIVVSGDLAQQIGAPVQRGQVLFEVAPLDSYRVAIEADESQIGDIHVGQSGRLVVTSLPNEIFPITVSKMTPVAKAHDGHNFFRVEARLNDGAPQLRPGMRGAAKLDVDDRRLAWIWGRSFINWVTLFAWRWFG
jgi:Barrel-sandwich domain of CusB or HlyD membrane-fusion/GAF domain